MALLLETCVVLRGHWQTTLVHPVPSQPTSFALDELLWPHRAALDRLMKVDPNVVTHLFHAAFKGIEGAIPECNANAAEVINASIAVAAGAIAYACGKDNGLTPEGVLQNKRSIRVALQRLILDHCCEGPVQ